jgi:hypothetical protein
MKKWNIKFNSIHLLILGTGQMLSSMSPYVGLVECLGRKARGDLNSIFDDK